MSEKPDWLPDIASVNGSWDETRAKLYDIFKTDFIHGKPKLGGYAVWWDRRKLNSDPYEEGFWHLITKKGGEDRLFDPRRAERLPWCVPTISNTGSSEVIVWDYEEARRKIRTYIWLKNWDYVIILQKRRKRIGTIAHLITAFHAEGDSTKRNLRRKFEARKA